MIYKGLWLIPGLRTHISESGRHYAHKENELSKANFEDNEFMTLWTKNPPFYLDTKCTCDCISKQTKNIGTKSATIGNASIWKIQCYHQEICYHAIRKYFIVKLFWLTKIVYLKFAVQYKIYKNYLAKKKTFLSVNFRQMQEYIYRWGKRNSARRHHFYVSGQIFISDNFSQKIWGFFNK